MTQQSAQSLIVPAYVWDDQTQRTAVLLRMGGVLATQAASIGMKPQADPRDWEVNAVLMSAVVGTHEVNGAPVDFVAYDVVQGDADLVFITVTATLIPVAP